jgi:hypothetical protein
MQYKKRRFKSGNKKEERRARSLSQHVPLKSCFPQLQQLVLDVEFSNPEGVVLHEDHSEYGPDDSINLVISCAGRCGDGQVNMQAKVESLARQRVTAGEGRSTCTNASQNSPDACGCELKCQIGLVYHPEPATST